MKRASVAVIAIALIVVVSVSGCVSSGSCSFDTASQKKVLESTSIKDCVDLCHKMGVLWRTEVVGLAPDKVQCDCYSCGG